MVRNDDPGPFKGAQSATTRSEPSETEWLDKELSGQVLALIRSAKSFDGDLGALRSRSQPDVFQYLWNNRCFAPGRPLVEYLLLEDMCKKLRIDFSQLDAKQPKFSQPPVDPTFKSWFEKRKVPRSAQGPMSPLRGIKQESPVSPTLGSGTQPGASSHPAKTSQTSSNQGMSGTIPQSPIPPNTAAAGSSAKKRGQGKATATSSSTASKTSSRNNLHPVSPLLRSIWREVAGTVEGRLSGKRIPLERLPRSDFYWNSQLEFAVPFPPNPYNDPGWSMTVYQEDLQRLHDLIPGRMFGFRRLAGGTEQPDAVRIWHSSPVRRSGLTSQEGKHMFVAAWLALLDWYDTNTFRRLGVSLCEVVGNAIRKNEENDEYIVNELLDLQARGYLKMDMVNFWREQG